MNRVELETSLQNLEREYEKAADNFYEFRKNPDIPNYEKYKDDLLRELCQMEDRINKLRTALSQLVEKVNKTCSRTKCAQCINHNKCDMEYDEV